MARHKNSSRDYRDLYLCPATSHDKCIFTSATNVTRTCSTNNMFSVASLPCSNLLVMIFMTLSWFAGTTTIETATRYVWQFRFNLLIGLPSLRLVGWPNLISILYRRLLRSILAEEILLTKYGDAHQFKSNIQARMPGYLLMHTWISFQWAPLKFWELSSTEMYKNGDQPARLHWFVF